MTISKQQMWALASACVGRRSDFALQQADGRYRRAGRPLDYAALRLHLSGEQTIGTYVTDEQGRGHVAVFDADSLDGVTLLLSVQRALAAESIPSSLELSRRGGHLWVFLSRWLPVEQLRRWLLPFCPQGVEFYPKRDWVTDAQPGAVMRLPFGVHRLSQRRYPFVTLSGDRLVPVASSVASALTWLSTVERAFVPDEGSAGFPAPFGDQPSTPFSAKGGALVSTFIGQGSIRDWCAAQNPLVVIGRYVSLDRDGMGCCPFGEHHANGRDSRPSLWVHRSVVPDVACWYCNVWRRGGDLFDFLSLYHRLSKKELWHRILGGEQF